MPPRRRQAKNRGLPAGLYRVHAGSDRYWEYANPVTGKRTKFTATKAEAIRATKAANAKLAVETELTDKLMGIQRETVALAVQRFRNEYLPQEAMSEAHRGDWGWRLRRIEKEIGNLTLREVQTKDLFDWLKPKGARTANVYRTKMIQLFDWGISVGLADWNPAKPLIVRKSKKQRQPLTAEAFRAIYRKANRPTRNAMALSLKFLQRRTDVAGMKLTDLDDGFIRVHQSKTGKRLKLPILPDMAGVIRRCKDGVFSPYLVHQPAGNKRRQGKPLSPASISRGFQRARDATGLFDNLPESERPTFHEILGLGEHMRRQQGWATEEIQAWRGHESPDMTEHYMEGHEHWEVVKPGGHG